MAQSSPAAAPALAPGSPTVREMAAAAPRAPLPPPRYALLLPLKFAPFRAVAEALRDGFMAAAAVGGEPALVMVVAHGENEANQAFERAVQAGAMVVVGPLTRADVATVLQQRSAFPPTLLLNLPETSNALPDQVVVLTLSVEADARQLARLAWKEGRERIAAIIGTGPLNQRFHAAYAEEAEKLGMSMLPAMQFAGDTTTLAEIRLKLEELSTDALLLALDAAQARVVRGYLSALPAYASGQVFDDRAATELVELVNVRFVEIPWLVQADHPAVMAYPRATLPDATAQRLYALGIDAYRVASQIAQGKALNKLELDGVTGQVSGRQGAVLVREPNTMVVREGNAVPLDPAR